MKKVNLTIAALLVLLISSLQAVAQSSPIDSLQKVLQTEKEDTNKVNTLILLGREYLNNSEFEKTITQCKDALALSEKINFLKGESNAYHVMGMAYDALGNYPEAVINDLEALKIREAIGDKKGIAGTSNNIGLVFVHQGNYAEGLKMFFKALKINETIGNKDWMIRNYNNIALIYLSQKQYPEALEYLHKELAYYENLGDRLSQDHAYNNIGNVYFEQGKYTEALKNYKIALDIRKEKNDQFEVGNSLSNLGISYEMLGNYSEALKNHFEALKIHKEVGNKLGIASALSSIASVKYKMKEYTPAKLYFDSALVISKEIESIESIMAYYDGVSDLDSALGDYKNSLTHYKLYIQYRDSLVNDDNKKQLVQQQMQYEFDKQQDSAKAAQDKKDALAALEITNQKIIRNISFALAILILAFSVYAFYRYKKKKQLQNQQALMSERLRISRELHDEVGATLSGIAMYSHLTKEQIKHANFQEVEKSVTVMQQSAGEMVNKLSDIVWLVNPDQDSLQKLIQRLEEYARDMAPIKNITVKVNAPENLHEHSLPMESRRNIYLFCKEAINNAVKYSNATLLELNIKEANNTLEFSVSDNGNGFDIDNVKRGNGLENMQKRADEVGARLTIASKENKGSLVSMQVKIT